MFEKLKNQAGIWKNVLSAGPSDNNIPNCDVLFFCYDVNRGESLTGKAYSKIFDIFQEELKLFGISSIQFAYPNSRLTGEKAFGSPFQANRKFAIADLKNSWFLRWAFAGHRKNEIRNLNYQHFLIYSGILEKCKPKCVMAIEPPLALIKACNLKRIKIVEILHGYGFTPNALPYLWNEELLPDGVVVFDDSSLNAFQEFVRSKRIEFTHLMFPPFLHKFLNPRNNDQIPEEWRECPLKLGNFKKKILVTLGWGYAGDHQIYKEFSGILSNGLIPETLLDVIKDTTNDFLWLFRLHPVHLRNPKLYKRHFDFLGKLSRKSGNVEWEWPTKAILPSVLRISDGHLSMRSETTYDASFFGIKSYLMCPTLRPGGIYSNYYDDLKQEGFVTIGDFTKPNIIRWLTDCEKMDKGFLPSCGYEADIKTLIEKCGLAGN